MVSILHANGSVVAQKRLGPTHFDVNGKLRPLAFNNLPLNQVEALHFLFEILDANNYRKTYRFSMAASFAFDLQFRSTTCLALTPPLPTTTGSSVPSTFAANQALPNFSEVKYAGFKSAVVDGTVYQFSGSRPLYIAQKAAQYTAASRLDGFVITDIVGNEIGSGATFTQILESPTIACFKQDSSGRWVRTIVRVG